MSSDNDLQEYLNWAHQQVILAQSSYKGVTLRAFYFTIGLAISLPLDFSLAREVEDEFKPHKLVMDRSSLTLALDRAFIVDLYHASRYTLQDFSFHPSHSKIFDYGFTNDYPILDFVLSSTFRHILSDDVKRLLQNLKKQLPESGRRQEQFTNWWRINGKIWTSQLKGILNQYRNIGYDWSFSFAQVEKLGQYYASNKLLVDCFNSNFYISRSLREDIEEMLLLPVAEIEKRKREKAE